AFRETRDPPTGLDVPIEVASPALRLTDHRHDVRPRTEHAERQRHHDRPQAELGVRLEEPLDGQRGVDRLLRGRGCGAADEESEYEGAFAHATILRRMPPVR